MRNSTIEFRGTMHVVCEFAGEANNKIDATGETSNLDSVDVFQSIVCLHDIVDFFPVKVEQSICV